MENQKNLAIRVDAIDRHQKIWTTVHPRRHLHHQKGELMYAKKDDRVGAVLGADKGKVEFLGFGVYEGLYSPKEAIGMVAEATKLARMRNPRIRLDSGKVVYGCECWWGPEDAVKEHLKRAKKVIIVDIDKIREKWEKENETEAIKKMSEVKNLAKLMKQGSYKRAPIKRNKKT